MLEVIFRKIPDILFIPVAAAAVLGIITAAVLCWRRRSAWYWCLAFVLVFTVSWRVAIQILSSRYASILIFPAVICAAYFVTKLDSLAGFIPGIPERGRKILPGLAVTGLVIGCLGQLFHYNTYGDHAIKTAALIKDDARNFSDSQILATDNWRLAYYSGLPGYPICPILETDEEYIAEIGNTVKRSTMFSSTVCYVAFSASVKHPPQYYLSRVPEFIRQEMTLLGEFYHNRKKKRVTRVYRYNLQRAYLTSCIAAGNVKDSGKKIKTFVFDKTYPETAEFYVREKKVFTAQGGRLQMPELKNFPDRWNASGSGGYEVGSNGQLGVTLLPDGRKVFRMKSDSRIAAYCLQGIPAKNYRMKITVSGVPGSVFALGAHFYTKKHLGFDVYPQMKIPGSGVWEFQLTQKYIQPGAEIMRIALQLYHGEIFIHSIELYEVDDKK